jgi:hypothetical protein
MAEYCIGAAACAAYNSREEEATMSTGPAIHISRDRFHLAWDPAIEPIETVESGAVVEFDLLDASGGQLTADSTVDDLARLDFDRVDQVNGPIAVTGAEPGDTLQVDLLEFEPADWGWTASIPGFGLLADDFPDPALRISRVPGAGGRAEFLPGVHVPIVPFCGEIGVAPVDGPRSTIPPDLHGDRPVDLVDAVEVESCEVGDRRSGGQLTTAGIEQVEFDFGAGLHTLDRRDRRVPGEMESVARDVQRRAGGHRALLQENGIVRTLRRGQRTVNEPSAIVSPPKLMTSR